MTNEQSAAIDESYRLFVIHPIAHNVKAARDRRMRYASRYYAQEFLQSDLCVYLVRLLGFGAGMTDAEIARSLIEGGGIADRKLTP